MEIRLQIHQVDRAHYVDRSAAANHLEYSERREYGFYSNVNPTVDHPRWSQASERLIGGFIAKRQPTQMFNGYAEEVAGLYAGMDLGKNY